MMKRKISRTGLSSLWELLGRIIPILALLSLLLGSYGVLVSARVADDAKRQSECQTRYNTINNERSRILGEAADEERQAERARIAALDKTFLDPALLKPPEQRTPEELKRIQTSFLQYRAAAQSLIKISAAADAARRQHPLPPPPNEVC